MKALKKITIVTGLLILCVAALGGCAKNRVKTPDQTTAPTKESVSTETETTAASSTVSGKGSKNEDFRELQPYQLPGKERKNLL